MTPFLAQQDEMFVRQAIELATLGRGGVEPNPMVGCVLVKHGRVIGQGHHAKFGGAHAEPAALASCTESPFGATAYVTLEPCCHVDKQTPPCVPALLSARIARVVIGCLDPNPRVNGKGVAQLRAAGVEVVASLVESESKQLIAPFVAKMEHGRPYVTLKWAQSADGKVAGPGGKRLFISNALSHRTLHELRARCDAILVGIGTVLADDPLLTARDVAHPRPLLRVVCDSELRIPVTSQLARSVAHGPVLVYSTLASYNQRHALVAALRSCGAQVVAVPQDRNGRLSLPDVLRDLGQRDISHLLVEPGPTIARSFIESGVVDRAWIFRSNLRVDDPTAPAAPILTYPATGSLDLDGDELIESLNPRSAVFFHSAASADFLRVVRARTP